MLLITLPIALLLLCSGIHGDSHTHMCGDTCIFLPFGDEAGDAELASGDDVISGAIDLPNGFNFMGESKTEIRVYVDGALLFGTGDVAGLYVFAHDIDTSLGGTIYYRATTNSTTLETVGQIVTKGYHSGSFSAFTPTWSLIVTYCHVVRAGDTNAADQRQENTFQAVVATDGSRVFTVFQYGDIMWGDQTTKIGVRDNSLSDVLLVFWYAENVRNIAAYSNEVVCGSIINRIDQATLSAPGQVEPCTLISEANCENGSYSCSTVDGPQCTCDEGFTGLLCQEENSAVSATSMNLGVAVVMTLLLHNLM